MEVYFWALYYLLVGVGTFIGAYTTDNSKETIAIRVISATLASIFWPIYLSAIFVIKIKQD